MKEALHDAGELKKEERRHYHDSFKVESIQFKFDFNFGEYSFLYEKKMQPKSADKRGMKIKSILQTNRSSRRSDKFLLHRRKIQRAYGIPHSSYHQSYMLERKSNLPFQSLKEITLGVICHEKLV